MVFRLQTVPLNQFLGHSQTSVDFYIIDRCFILLFRRCVLLKSFSFELVDQQFLVDFRGEEQHGFA
jgi:hypothetical protein